MARTRTAYSCAECGAHSPKWQGQCPACGAWNTLEPVRQERVRAAPAAGVRPSRLSEVEPEGSRRIPTGLGELDHVLGGGMVPGSVVLVGGDPGIGKSTLLIQAAAHLGAGPGVLYVSGEESLHQVGLRARRLGLDPDRVLALATTRVEDVIDAATHARPACVVVDSIQTMSSELLPSAPGSPNQLRTCAGMLVRLAKEQGIVVILVGHVTKEGQLAGPRLLEHMVDAVLYFENDPGSRFRVLRAVKNRFGAANEVGVFMMTDSGVREVRNPSAMFISQRARDVPGSVVTATHQGSRPLMVEVQALTDHAGGSPRRIAVGLDQSRLTVLLAALHRHAGIPTHDRDVFLNVVGGVRIAETSGDLAALVATVSSISGRCLPHGLLVFGEVGLAGEIRPVAYGEERLREAARVGFTQAIVPTRNLPRQKIDGLQLAGAETLRDVIAQLGLEEAPSV